MSYKKRSDEILLYTAHGIRDTLKFTGLAQRLDVDFDRLEYLIKKIEKADIKSPHFPIIINIDTDEKEKSVRPLFHLCLY